MDNIVNAIKQAIAETLTLNKTPENYEKWLHRYTVCADPSLVHIYGSAWTIIVLRTGGAKNEIFQVLIQPKRTWQITQENNRDELKQFIHDLSTKLADRPDIVVVR